MSKLQASLPAVMLALSLAACGGASTPDVERTPVEGPGPQLVVERFLQAANANDWDVMGELFGTPDYTIAQRDGATRSDRHMLVLSSLLRHDDFVVRGRTAVPGERDATNIVVDIIRDQKTISVPFMVVRRRDGGWIIQQIDRLEDLT